MQIQLPSAAHPEWKEIDVGDGQYLLHVSAEIGGG